MNEHPNLSQQGYWSAAPGARWIENEAVFDRLLGGANAPITQAAMLRPGAKALDVGCGTGALSLDLASAVGPAGEVTALDFSRPFLDRAATRAQLAGLDNISFLNADAQTHDFQPPSFDAIVSRFGVMFFADPTAAFANIRAALSPQGRLAFACWGPREENPWFSLPRRIAIARMGQPEAADPRAPGPFAFAERDYVRGIMEDAGFADVQATPMTLELCPPGTAAEVGVFAAETGPAARIVEQKGGGREDIAAIASELREVLEEYETPAGVRLPSKIYLCQGKGG